MDAPSRPLLIFDGDCGFCRSWVARWRRRIDGHVDVAPSQRVGPEHPEIPPARFAEAVVLLEPDGAVHYAAAAVFAALAHAPRGGLGWWLYRHVPGFAPLTEAVYRTIARHRGAATAVTRALWGEHVLPPETRATSEVFVRLLGLVYLMAFGSLAVQIRGLVGHDGILPAADFLARVAARYGAERFLLLPTLLWIHPGDGMLLGLCVAGIVGSVLVTGGLSPRVMLFVLWVLYLSLAVVGGEFLWFQWDSLLLEAGLVGVLLAPWRFRPAAAPPARAAVWLARWLLFRLLVSSALVKLASGDPTWRHLTALEYHYQTQPLPPWTAWYAHHLPAAFQRFSALAMFGIEGLAPFLLFAPRRARILGAATIAFLQTLILLTGNYGFFNWLTLALCVLSLDDAAWPRVLRRLLGLEPVPLPDPASLRARPRRVVTAIAIVLIVLGVVPLLRATGMPDAWLGPLPLADELVSPLHVVNAYGLFAVMTTERSEIQVEGSDDGRTWRPYAFRWKPGDPRHRPAFVFGHMPRLDWQMWFAALDPGHPASWLLHFVLRLLEGSPSVRALLAADPFPDRAPRYVRAELYDYRFSDAATRRATGAWWVREHVAGYLPPLTLRDGQLVLATELAPATP